MSRRRTRRGSTYAWRRLRLQVLERDNHKCAYPGCPVTATEVDHIIPVDRGGTDDPSNLQAMCGPHNRAKHNGELPSPGINPTKGSAGMNKPRPAESPQVPSEPRYVPRLP